MAKLAPYLMLLVLWPGRSVSAQEPLTLAEAVDRARTRSTEARIAELDADRSRRGVDDARAGFFPLVHLAEGWQRGNQPVFAFGALLSQRRLTERDFEIGRLTRPAALDNFQSVLGVEQPLFDAGLLPAMRAARLQVAIATDRRDAVGEDLLARTATAYGRVLLYDALARAATSALEAAEADLERARGRRDEGLATDADVLSVDVHRADVLARQIEAVAEERIARQELNDAIGEPLDRHFTLLMPPDGGGAGSVEDLETEALEHRGDFRIARLERELSEAAVASARAAFLPRVAFQGTVEWNGTSFGERERSWVMGIEVRLNLSSALRERARLARARVGSAASTLRAQDAEDRVRLEVRAATARVEAARARVQVGEAAVRQAAEGQRIVRDRYDNGLADIVAVLRSAQARYDAEAQLVAARVDAAVQYALLEAALGR